MRLRQVEDDRRRLRDYWNFLFTISRWSGRPHLHILTQIAELFNYNLKGLRILEVGAGSGADSAVLSKLGAHAFAVDYATAHMIVKRWGTRLHVHQADGENLPFKSGVFDLSFSQGLVEHYRNPDHIIREQVRVVRKGGFIIIDAPQRYSLYHLYKSFLVAIKCWPMGWERSYSVFDMRMIAKHYGLKLVKTTGWGSWPISAGRIRELKCRGWPLLPEGLLKVAEENWRKIEGSKVSSYIGMNITAVFMKN